MRPQEPSTSGESQDRRFSPPAVSLPTGGGAIKGIGEKFAANPVTGTGSLSIPLPLSPGRSGFTPPLALTYDSGAGNGPYGFGWNIGYPAITRRTDRGLPRYAEAAQPDVFMVSGAEDLVPVTGADGSPLEEERDGYRVTRYRPRIEGLFARIERWTHLTDAADTFWRSISRDNVSSFYGRTAASRIADPRASSRTFSWLLCESCDDKGNAAAYDYVAEDGANVDVRLPTAHPPSCEGCSMTGWCRRKGHTMLKGIPPSMRRFCTALAVVGMLVSPATASPTRCWNGTRLL